VFAQRSNVHYLGPKPVEQVPLYVNACDVGLIPYKQDGFAPFSDSLKLYEYLACGRPVVSSEMPSSRRFAPLVRVAEGVDGFATAIEACLAEDPGNRMERMVVAERHSWEHRVALMREIVGAALADPAGGR
jgi:teichuronic acid biosynthesis glycosyltransferase TuaH